MILMMIMMTVYFFDYVLADFEELIKEQLNGGNWLMAKIR